MSRLTLVEQATAPDTPGTNQVVVYANSDGSLCAKNDAGTVRVAPGLGVANTFTAAQTFSVAPQVPPALGSNVFSLDASGSSYSMAASTSRNLTTSVNFSGLVIITENYNGYSALYLFGGASVVLLNVTGANVFSSTFNTASRINVYQDSGGLSVQNLTAETRGIYVMALRTRAA
jgi:hypothetical protein